MKCFGNTVRWSESFGIPVAKTIRSLLVAVGCFGFGTACTTTGKGQQTADGQLIPGKKFFQFAEYEYVCEPTMGQDHTEIEHQLDRYGAKGWRLAGFMQKNGDTTAFCLMR